MSRQVSHATLHQPAHIPGAGTLGATFPPSAKVLQDLKMHVDELGLHISFTYQAQHLEALVPLANVVIMRLVPEAKPALKAVKSA